MGVIVNRDGVLCVKYGDETIPVHPNDSFDVRVGDEVKFERKIINDKEYATIQN